MPFFFIALLCTLQAAKDILYWKGNHDSSPDRINLTAVQSLAVCHVTVPARLIFFFYSIDETPPSIEFWFCFLIGQLPKHPDAHQRSPPTASDLSAVTFKGTERESEKNIKSSKQFSFIQSSGREGRSDLRIWNFQTCQISKVRRWRPETTSLDWILSSTLRWTGDCLAECVSL